MSDADWAKVIAGLVGVFVTNGVALVVGLNKFLGSRFDKMRTEIAAEAKLGRQEIGHDLHELRDELRGIRADLVAVATSGSRLSGQYEGLEKRVVRLERRNGGRE